MNVRSLGLICLFSLFLTRGLFAQTLFSERMTVCDSSKFCLDCGDIKATCDQFTLDEISGLINRRYMLGSGFWTFQFQVLVDPSGFSCVLSYSDVTHSPLTADLIRALNGARWKPAIEKGVRTSASVNVEFNIAGGKMSGHMKRMDPAELALLGDPTISNKQYKYSNPSLSGYDFATWTKYNSLLPDNKSIAAVTDKSDNLWYATPHGLARFDGQKFALVNQTNSPLDAAVPVNALATEKENVWMSSGRSVYSTNGTGWLVYDSAHLSIAGAGRIINNPEGEMFFTSNKGLLILRVGRIRLMDQKLIPELPSNKVYYAYYDTHKRLWIGTAQGNIMIDKQQKVTRFTDENSPLNNAYITNMQEDEQGNLYFSLTAFKNLAEDNDDEGIAVLSAEGKWSHYTDKNSGMPSNHVNSILYDKFEHVLWIGTQQAGLVRFDLKDGWEDYHNANSAVPAYEVDQLAQDSKGTIYAGTANGLLRIKKK